MKIIIAGKTFEIKDKLLKDELSKDIPSEITIESDFIIRTEKEDDSFFKSAKKIGVKEGVEIPIKKYKLAHDLNPNSKSLDDLILAANEKALEEANINPSEEIKTARKKIQDKEEALTLALKRGDNYKNDLSTFKDGIKISSVLNNAIPDGCSLSNEDMGLILNSKITFGITENNAVGVLDSTGEFVTSKTTGEPIEAKTAIEDYFKSNPQYLSPLSGKKGKGFKNSENNTEGKITIDEFIESQTEKGVNVNSTEFNKNLDEAIKENIVDV